MWKKKKAYLLTIVKNTSQTVSLVNQNTWQNKWKKAISRTKYI